MIPSDPSSSDNMERSLKASVAPPGCLEAARGPLASETPAKHPPAKAHLANTGLSETRADSGATLGPGEGDTCCPHVAGRGEGPNYQ